MPPPPPSIYLPDSFNFVFLQIFFKRKLNFPFTLAFAWYITVNNNSWYWTAEILSLAELYLETFTPVCLTDSSVIKLPLTPLSPTSFCFCFSLLLLLLFFFFLFLCWKTRPKSASDWLERRSERIRQKLADRSCKGQFDGRRITLDEF